MLLVWPRRCSQPWSFLSLQAHIQFRPTLSQQQQSGGLLNGNFIIRYDVIHTPSGGSIQVCGLQAGEGQDELEICSLSRT